jgi:hypothetical protein
VTDSQHLSPELIAAYLAREASAEEHQAVQKHLLACRACREDVDEAGLLTAGRRPRRWVIVAIPAAAAAAALFLLLPGPGVGPERTTVRGPGTEGVRQFAVVRPTERMQVAGDSVVFQWRSEGPEVHYVLTLTDEDGDVVWSAGTPDTVLVPPRGAGLKPGSRYFWYVDALLDGARSSTTGVREFTVRP